MAKPSANRSLSRCHHDASALASYADSIREASESLAETTHSIAGGVESIVEAAASARAHVASAVRSAEDVSGELRVVHTKMGLALSEVGRLVDAVRSVESIIRSVQSISEQTDLLALNAKIEASRAGRFGGGFAIVAQEVGQLSGRTRKAVMNIDELLRRVGTGTKQAIDTIRECQAAVTLTVEYGVGAARVLDAARGCTNTVGDQMLRMRASIAEQRVAVANIADNVGTICHQSRSIEQALAGLAEGEEGDDAQADLQIVDVEPADVASLPKDTAFVDVRSADEYVDELGHIEGARLMPIKEGFEQALETLDPRRPTLFICRSGGRSMKAAMHARDRGFQHIFNMTGGMLQWVANGLPTRGASRACSQ